MLELMLEALIGWFLLVAAIVIGVLTAAFLRLIARDLWLSFEYRWARLMWWLDL